MFLYVYGTLKKGRNNHGYLDGANYMGNFITSEDYSLIVSGLPFLVKRKSKLGGVRGEVYKIDRDILTGIDKLEGHPGFYRREVTTVINEDTKEPLDVFAYVHPDVFNNTFDYSFKVCREY